MSRRAVHLGRPREPEQLRAYFPRAQRLPENWYRAHSDKHISSADRGCWWFSSHVPPGAVEGRFDLPSPYGTCYFADDVEAAVRERLGPVWGSHDFLSSGALVGTTVSIAPLIRYVSDDMIADTDTTAAAPYVTRELSTTADYDLTQCHAKAFADAGFAGILYAPRFTPGRVQALALFGRKGAPKPPRAAFEVEDWHAYLASPLRSTVSRSRAEIIP